MQLFVHDKENTQMYWFQDEDQSIIKLDPKISPIDYYKLK